MCMVTDVILAVAEIAIATGTVTEFQLRIGNIGSAAYGAAVEIGFLGLLACFSGEGDCAAGFLRLLSFGLAVLQLVPPLGRQYIDHIPAEEQKVIGQCHQGEQVVGENCNSLQNLKKSYTQINKCQNPRPDGNYKEYHEPVIRILGGEAQQQTQVQETGYISGVIIRNIFCRGSWNCNAAAGHSKNVHQNDTGEIVQVKAERTPGDFHNSAQRVIAVQ